MYIKQDQVQKAVENADKKCKLLNVQFNPALFEAYEKKLQEIAEKSNYKEGEPISKDDFNAVTMDVGMLLSQLMTETIALYDDDPESKQITNCVDYMMTAADYLYAKTMQKLGSPDIEPLFGDKIQENLCRLSRMLHNHVAKFDISTDNTYKAQRGKNAKELLSDGVDARIQAVETSQAKIKDVAQLIADYQALQRRQEGHGAVWRFFHRGENKARTELLTRMENVLRVHLSGKNPDAVDPTHHAKKTSTTKNEEYLNSALEARKNPEKIYGLNEPEKNSNSRAQLSEKEMANLIEETATKKNASIQAPVQKNEEQKQLSNEVKI